MGNGMKKIVWDLILLIGTLAVLFSGYLIYYEVHGANLFCESIDGEYTLHFYPLPIHHECDGKVLVKYYDGWEFEGERSDYQNNFTIIIP